jgi:hypothetical protein
MKQIVIIYVLDMYFMYIKQMFYNLIHIYIYLKQIHNWYLIHVNARKLNMLKRNCFFKSCRRNIKYIAGCIS